MPGVAAGWGPGMLKERQKTEPNLRIVSNTAERKNIGNPLADFMFKVGSKQGEGMAKQVADPTRTDIPGIRLVSQTPAPKSATGSLTESAKSSTAPKGRVPSGKRARKHNVRRR